MEMSSEDYELAKISLCDKIVSLCEKFLKDVGRENMELHISTTSSTFCKDEHGNKCYGRRLSAEVSAWNFDEGEILCSLFDDDVEEDKEC